MPKPPIDVKVKFETEKFNRMLRAKVIPSSRLAGRDVIRTAALEVLNRTIKCWPVDTGRSRAAWSAVFDLAAARADVLAHRWQERGNPLAIAQGRRKGEYKEQETLKGFTATLVNGVDYAPALEGGSSTQAPTGCLRNAMSVMRREIGRSPMVRKFIIGLEGVKPSL